MIDNDYAADAIRHLSLAGDAAGAAELVVDHWTDFLQHGDLTSINNALDDVGEDAVRRDPRLCLVRAWMTINLGRIAELGGWSSAYRAEQAGNHLAVMHALGCLALTAADRGDELGALRIAEHAMAVRDAHGFAEHWASAMAHLARARVLSARGDVVLAEQAGGPRCSAVTARARTNELAFGLLTWADLRLRQHDRQQAIAFMTEADATLRACSDPGLVQDLARERRQVGRRPGPPRATDAGRERVIVSCRSSPCCRPSHLREVAATLFVSMNTVKTHTRSIYRKLGASTRAEAVHRAGELGLV